MRVAHCRILPLILAANLLVGCDAPEQPVGARQTGPDAELIATNNRGVGLMGQFKYDDAHALFAGLAEAQPEWLEVQVNLAIATLNRQQEGDEPRALGIVDQVLARDPGQLRAHYVAGLLRLYLGQTEAALAHFGQVAEADPDDAYAAYYFAQCLAQSSQHEAALDWYRRAQARDPYLRSAYYGIFQSLQRLRRTDEARVAVADYQRLANNPRGRLAEFKYTRMGPKAEALAIGAPGSRGRAAPPGPIFTAARILALTSDVALPWRERATPGPVSLTAADIDHDGVRDLFVTGVLTGTPAANLVLTGGADQRYTPLLSHPLARVDGVNAALWGDYDNDGRLDVYLCRRGPNQLWRQDEHGQWQDVTAATATAGGAHNTVDGLFFDADHDGDLDLFLVNADGADELLNNNLDGTFRPLAAEHGLDGAGRASRLAVAADLDGDRDADIVVLHATPPHAVYVNDRLWRYRPAPGFERFAETPALTAVTGDIDADGLPELYTVDPGGALLRWRADTGGNYDAERLAQLALGSGHWAALALADVDGSGVPDLLAVSAAGWQALKVAGGAASTLFEAKAKATAPLAGALPLLTRPVAGAGLLALRERELIEWSPGPGRHRMLALQLSGKEDSAQSMRSNASGIGARVAVRAGSHWSVADTFRHHSGPGQSQQPLSVGIGGAERADFVAIDWSDGVFQSELGLEAGQLHRIAETQRQLSSCPVLFAWDGAAYTFVSDVLGVGGVGYALGPPGEYAPPRPWENFLLPPDRLQPRDGRYVIKVAEPMEEVAYLDAARLVAYDLPPGWQLVLDERMGILGPEPTGRAHYFRTELLPVSATSGSADVTDAVTVADGRAAPVGTLDRRFIGRLREDQVLTLHFAEPLDGHGGEPVLVADGWVEYPYSQTMFAAWQAGASYDAPTLQARGADGAWHTVLAQFGYPAGMPRRMSVPLRGLPPGTNALRLRTNMQVYWDRLSVVMAEPLLAARTTTLPLRLARVAATGFAQRTTAAQYRPHYDYARRSPFGDTRFMAGHYTRFGPATELVIESDDAVAIIGPGEEIHLEFEAPDPPPAGWLRSLVLETNGWAKDMDMHTADGETVAPVPSSGRPSEPRARLHATYNTRYQAGR